MPLSSAHVGAITEPVEYEVDARWLMAYAAGLGDTDPCYLDTTAPLAMHPLFPVCLEWDSILALRFGPFAAGMTAAEQARAVHADHDLHLLADIAPGTRVSTTATAIAVEQRRPGAYLLKRIDTVDSRGRLCFRTWQGTLYRGVTVDGPDRALEAAPPWPAAAEGPACNSAFEVPANTAHVYTECARIWNPIHTDHAHAVAAGLPGIILHGTATLALAASRLVADHAGGNPRRVRRIGGRFSGMVAMPTMLSLETTAAAPGALGFRVVGTDGRDVISRGFLEYAP